MIIMGLQPKVIGKIIDPEKILASLAIVLNKSDIFFDLKFLKSLFMYFRIAVCLTSSCPENKRILVLQTKVIIDFKMKNKSIVNKI